MTAPGASATAGEAGTGDGRLSARWLLPLAVVVPMLAAGPALRLPQVVFPEGAALAAGLWTLNSPAWACSRTRLLVLPPACAASGTYSKLMCWVALDRAIALADWLDAADRLDASALIPITGFLPTADPRVRATVDAVRRDLTGPDGLVYRYRGDDGQPRLHRRHRRFRPASRPRRLTQPNRQPTIAA